MGLREPSFFLMKKKGDPHGELTFLMHPSSSFLLVNLAAAWILFHAKG
jgi:hypothetical protein